MRIGIDLGGTKIAGVVLADDGRELAQRRVATPATDYSAIVTTIAAMVSDLESAVGSTATVGVGMPGTISPATGLIKGANTQCLIGQRLDADLSTLLERPVRVANDANCFALSEAVDGAATGAATMFGVILGTGVGGGLVVHGRPLGGHNAIAGEWGHNPLPWPMDDERPGSRCYCGRSGCIETFLSGPGLVADHRRATGETRTAEDIARTADPASEATMQRYERRLARALATVINLYDPDVIVLGGGLSDLARLYDTVPRLWQGWCFSDVVTTPLRRAKHGATSGVRGAAWLWPAA
jgi:fructokinase